MPEDWEIIVKDSNRGVLAVITAKKVIHCDGINVIINYGGNSDAGRSSKNRTTEEAVNGRIWR